jgi:GNAT superfamily N-acetyltransferase
VYTQRDVDARQRQFAWFFAQLIRDGVRKNGAYGHGCPGRPDGVAVWQRKETDESAPDVTATVEPDELEQLFGPEAYRRFAAYRHFEEVHRQCVADPHWYLAVVGVRPGFQGRGIGGALLAPVLLQADEEGLPCYLETFVADNVLFYEHRGFEVVAAGVHLESRIPFWAMKREPI